MFEFYLGLRVVGKLGLVGFIFVIGWCCGFRDIGYGVFFRDVEFIFGCG